MPTCCVTLYRSTCCIMPITNDEGGAFFVQRTSVSLFWSPVPPHHLVFCPAFLECTSSPTLRPKQTSTCVSIDAPPLNTTWSSSKRLNSVSASTLASIRTGQLGTGTGEARAVPVPKRTSWSGPVMLCGRWRTL